MRIPFIALAIAVSLLLFLACGTTKNPVDSARTGRPDTYQNTDTMPIWGSLEPGDFYIIDSGYGWRLDTLEPPAIIVPPDTGDAGPIIDPPDWP